MLHLLAKSHCPQCASIVRTDGKFISLIEAVVGLPALWALGSLLRVWLKDSSGVLSYSLLILPMLLLHVYVVGYFATARVETDEAKSS
jgi:hypothetical protein